MGSVMSRVHNERKKLKDIAMALRVPEIHFGAILEDLALWLEEQKAK